MSTLLVAWRLVPSKKRRFAEERKACGQRRRAGEAPAEPWLAAAHARLAGKLALPKLALPKLALPWFAVLLLSLCGCAPYAYRACPPHVTPALGKMVDKHAIIPVLYATDRRPTGAHSTALYFGGDRSRDVHYGTCPVSIPPRHGCGRLEAALLGIGESPRRHVSARAIEPSDRAAFVGALRERVAKSKRHEVLVVIHGFKELFVNAARTTAQLAHDVEFDGAAVLYSWPTQGWLASYLVDESNVNWTYPHLVELMTLLVEESGAERIHILAHSMGCRVLVFALQEYARRHPVGATPAFDQIIFAAADIDAEIFARDYGPDIAGSARRFTIYRSTADWALGASLWLHKYTRLGREGLPDPSTAWAARYNVIDATRIDRGIVGHFYYHASPTLLDDLKDVLRDTTAEQRGLLRIGDEFRIDPKRLRKQWGVDTVPIRARYRQAS